MNRLVRDCLIVFGMSFFLLGAEFYSPKVEGYRIWIGEDEVTDWIDVCCEQTNDGKLLWADYTPIQTITIERMKGGFVHMLLSKEYSRWELSGYYHDSLSWSLHRVLPRQSELKYFPRKTNK